MNFIRLLRTRTSEVYGILDGSELMIGRIDLHYADDGRISGVVSVTQNLSSDEEIAICNKIDDEIVDAAELTDDQFEIVFYQVRSVNVYGNEGS